MNLLENLLVSADDVLKICDFGVAQGTSNSKLCNFLVLDNSRQQLHNSRGSPAFLAPEMSSSKFKSYSTQLWKARNLRENRWTFGHAVSPCIVLFLEEYHFMEKTTLSWPERFKLKSTQFKFKWSFFRLQMGHPVHAHLEDLLRRLLEKDPHKRLTMEETKVEVWCCP